MRISDWSSDVCSSDLAAAATRYQRDLAGKQVGAIDRVGRPDGFGRVGVQLRLISVAHGGAQLFSNSPAMIILRTSVVPAPISSSLIERYRRLISDSQM